MDNNNYDITKNNNYGLTESDNRGSTQDSFSSSRDISTANSGYIVINKHELNTEYVNNRIKEEKESKRDLNKAERIPVETNIFFNPVFYTAICGMFAALIGWGPIEAMAKTQEDTIMESLIIVVTMAIGCCISALDSVMSGNFPKAIRNGAIGLGSGLFSGVLFHYVGNLLFRLLLGFIALALLKMFPSIREHEPKLVSCVLLMSARAPIWALLGAGIGIIPGIANKSQKLMFNGVIGGMIGGFMGGFFFDPISFLAHSIGTTQGGWSRGVGLSVLGLMIGVFIGLVENMAKDVWVTMKSGPLRGKQFVIYHNPTLIGSSPRSDIYIFKDPNVMPTHAKIQKKGSKYEIIDDSKGVGVYVNSEKINGSKILESDDTIIVGQSILQFQQKERR